MPTLDSFRPGTMVQYKAHRDWGIGLVITREPNGLLSVRFDDVMPPYLGEFGDAELMNAESVEAVA